MVCVGTSLCVLFFLATVIEASANGSGTTNASGQDNATLAATLDKNSISNVIETNKGSWIFRGNRKEGGGGGGGGGGGVGGGGGGSFGWGWGWGWGGGGGGGGAGWWKWGCQGGPRRGGGRNRGGEAYVENQDYFIGEFAQCMARTKCKGMRLDCPLHCGGPCFYDCQHICTAHCRRP